MSDTVTHVADTSPPARDRNGASAAAAAGSAA